MSERIARPSFYEGQVLMAADLDLGQGYARGTMARHERYLHTPGIATGLGLTLDKSTGVAVVKMAPGIAIDVTGRQIVVDREETLAAEELDSQGVLTPPDTDPALKQEDRPWHAVFLTGRDESATPTSFSRGCGGGAQPTRMDEAYVISYGRPGDAGEDQVTIEVTDGPEAGSAVRVVVGYVQWDAHESNFGDAKSVVPRAGARAQLSPPYAGARADEVVARGGTLALRADQGPTREKRPALVLDGDDGGEMRFGLQNTRGEVNTVFKVNAAGDLTLAGVIKSPFSNDMWVESGTISDGLLVPLPQGVTQQMVDDGKVTLHVTVTPRRVSEESPPGKSGVFFKEPFECHVDGRRVFVRERWFDVTSLAALGTPTVIPGACDYVVIASVAGSAS